MAVAITSTILAVFGNHVNKVFKDVIRQRHFIVRVTAFVLLVTFGFGAINLLISHVLAKILAGTNDLYLFPIILGTFIAIGVIAEQKNHI